MTEAIKQERFARDFDSGASYVKFSSAAVACTVRIEGGGADFLADYDASGAVRGVEFVGGRRSAVEHYRAVSERHGKGGSDKNPKRERRT